MRSYTDTDLEPIISLIRSHLEDYVTIKIGAWENSEAILRTDIPLERNGIRVVEVDHRIAGFVWFDHRDHYLFIEEIHVRIDVQGQGIGRNLMQEAERLARWNGHPEVRLAVFAGSPAVDFYRSMGYKTCGSINQHNQLTYRKIL